MNKNLEFLYRTDFLKMNYTGSLNLTFLYGKKNVADMEPMDLDNEALHKLIEYYIDQAGYITENSTTDMYEYDDGVADINRLNLHQYILLGNYQAFLPQDD